MVHRGATPVRPSDSTATAERGAELTATLRVQRPATGSQGGIIDRLDHLAGAEVIEQFSIETLPEEIILSEDDRRSAHAILFERCDEWAESRGLSVRTAFDVDESASRLGRRVTRAKPPRTCLTVRDDGDLVGVFPCTDGDRTWSVTDALDHLQASGELPPAVTRRSETA